MPNVSPSRAASARTIALAGLTLAASVFAAACASAPRNPILDKYPIGVSGRTTVLYYDVHGHTFAELRADMRRLGPKVDGRTFVGETRSPMGWTWRTEGTGRASCAIRDVRVLVNAQITLPRWTPPADTEPGLVTEWKRFLAALETHEAGHKDISAKAARQIIEQLRGLSGLCSQIGTRANDLARVIIERANAEQRAYDLVTRHGYTQGTTFGPSRFVAAADPFTLLAEPRVGTVRGVLAAPIDQVWTALPDAYSAAGFIVNATDSVARAVGDSLSARGTIAAIPLSDVVDCGVAPSAQSGDSVDVALFVTSRLEASQPSTTTVTNTVQAVAHLRGAAPIVCRSRAVIERRLLDALRERFTR